MTDKPVPRTVEEYLEQAWGYIDAPEKWHRGGLHSPDGARHCSLGALEMVYREHARGEGGGWLKMLQHEAGRRLALLPGRKRPINVADWNDHKATFRSLRARWMQAMGRNPKQVERPEDRPPITPKAEAARSLRARLGFPRHLETITAREHDLSISGD